MQAELTGLRNTVQEGDEKVIKACADKGGPGDGQDPGPDDATRNAPAHSGEAARSSDANDGPGDGVGRADGNAEDGIGHDGDAAGGFRGETAERSELSNALAHCFDDAPAAGHRTAAHRQMTAKHDPEGHG